jgi:hypothetical protein
VSGLIRFEAGQKKKDGKAVQSALLKTACGLLKAESGRVLRFGANRNRRARRFFDGKPPKWLGKAYRSLKKIGQNAGDAIWPKNERKGYAV